MFQNTGFDPTIVSVVYLQDICYLILKTVLRFKDLKTHQQAYRLLGVPPSSIPYAK